MISNQSKLHYELTKKTGNWLANKVTQRGMKWMQEFTLTSGLRCDAVAFGCLQISWWEKLCGVKPIMDYMFIFETKVSKEDFYSTYRRSKKAPKRLIFSNFHFIVLPKDLMVQLLPDFPKHYGVLREFGRGLKLERKPAYCHINSNYFYANAYNMMFRVDKARWTDKMSLFGRI